MASIEEKGRRLLTEGRLVVTYAAPDSERIQAECRGDSGEFYACGFDPGIGEWFCDCPARSKCAHQVALMLVTIRHRNREEE